jgi:hypothetical protein
VFTSYKASISTEHIVFILILRNKKTSKYAPGRAWVGTIYNVASRSERVK